jgi:hypothetical protein
MSAHHHDQQDNKGKGLTVEELADLRRRVDMVIAHCIPPRHADGSLNYGAFVYHWIRSYLYTDEQEQQPEQQQEQEREQG